MTILCDMTEQDLFDVLQSISSNHYSGETKAQRQPEADRKRAVVLYRRYVSDPRWTYRAIADDFGVSIPRIRQIHDEALKRMRRPWRARWMFDRISPESPLALAVFGDQAPFYYEQSREPVC